MSTPNGAGTGRCPPAPDPAESSTSATWVSTEVELQKQQQLLEERRKEFEQFEAIADQADRDKASEMTRHREKHRGSESKMEAEPNDEKDLVEQLPADPAETGTSHGTSPGQTGSPQESGGWSTGKKKRVHSEAHKNKGGGKTRVADAQTSANKFSAIEHSQQCTAEVTADTSGSAEESATDLSEEDDAPRKTQKTLPGTSQTGQVRSTRDEREMFTCASAGVQLAQENTASVISKKLNSSASSSSSSSAAAAAAVSADTGAGVGAGSGPGAGAAVALGTPGPARVAIPVITFVCHGEL